MRPALCTLLFALAALACAPRARAADVRATGACPTAEAVAAALAVLLPPDPAEVQPRVQVEDRGTQWGVDVVGAASRVYVDEARDCTERARVAAIFAALTLRPPQVAGEPPPPPAPPPPGPRRFAELSFAAEIAPSAVDAPIAVGADIRLGLGGRVAITGSLGARSSVTLPLRGGAEARLTRVPMDVGLRLLRAWGRTDVSLDVGVAAAWLLLEGAALPATERHGRLDVGGRAAALIAWRAAPGLAPFGGVAGILSPRRYELAVDGLGVAGDTPSTWIGVILGLRLDWSAQPPQRNNAVP